MPKHLAIVPKEQPCIIVVTLMVYAQIRLYKSRLTDYIMSDSRYLRPMILTIPHK